MLEEEHGFPGMGHIILTHRKSKKHEAEYYFPKWDIRIKLDDSDAKKLFREVIIKDEIDINLIMRLACDACNIPLFRIKEKTRKEESVFARYLVIWYLNKHMRHSDKNAGNIFNKDRATAIHARKMIDEDPKYLKPSQQIWRKIFMRKLKENDLL